MIIMYMAGLGNKGIRKGGIIALLQSAASRYFHQKN